MPWLATEGAAHQLADGETLVGSGPHAAWRLVSHDLAPKHFIVTMRGERATLRLRSIEPTFTVNDLDRSVRFYTDVLGFELVTDMPMAGPDEPDGQRWIEAQPLMQHQRQAKADGRQHHQGDGQPNRGQR